MANIINAITTGGGGISTTADASGSIQFATNNGTTAMTIDTSQNVGIGTTSPSEKLHVVGGNIKTDSSSRQIGYWETSGLFDGYFVPYDNSGFVQIVSSFSSGGVLFKTGNSKTERMRIDSSGNVLVNTTSTSSSNNNGFTIETYVGGVIGNVGHNGSAANGDAYINFRRNGTVLGSITQVSSTGVAFNTTSDYRLKENIAPMTGALDKVLQLNPVTYKWKVDGSDGQGFIAHELQTVVPDCVVGEKDAVDDEGNPKYQGVDTSFLVATLTAAIQEQQTIINELKSRIEVLEGAK